MPAFIAINGQDAISLGQAFRYLQRIGEVDAFIGNVLRQYLLEQAFEQDPELAIAPTEIEQKMLEFRQNNQLTDSFQYREWLESQGLDEALFQERFLAELRIYKLREHLAELRLQEYFIERKLFCDQVILSRIVVAEQELAEELFLQLQDGASFENLAREYSITDDGLFNGMFGKVSRGNLPDALRAKLDIAIPGSVVNPIDMEGNWYIFRLEHNLPATLDNPAVRQALLDELLEEWILDRLRELDIEISLGDEDAEELATD
ncbi:MAG: peptidylprolyl isomerase [Cyanobacteria bacterium J06638_20]